MAIQYVGGVSAGRTGNSNATTTQSLTGLSNGIASAPAEGDLVIVCCASGSQGRNPSAAISGYTTLGTQLNTTAVTYDSSMQVSWKVMTATPDTSITIPAQGNIADGQAWSVMVFRGVDTSTPFDVTSVSATGTGTGRPDPAAIEPTTSGAWIVCAAAAAAAATTTAFTFPTDLSDDAVQGTGADTNDARASLAYHDGWTSGSYNPAAYTGGTTGANDSWTAWTMALRPELTQTLTQSSTFSNSNSLAYSHTLTLYLSPDLFSNSNSLAYAHTLSQAIELTQSATFTNSNSLAYTHQVDLTLTASLFSNSNSLAYQHALALNLTPDLFTNSNSLAYQHDVSQGQTLTQDSRFDNANALAYAHTLTPGAVTLTQSATFSNSNALAYGHTLALNLTAALFTNDNSLAYAHTLTPGEVTLTASLFTNANSLAYTHTLTPGTVTLTQSATFTNSNSLAFAHTLSQVLQLTPSLFSNDQTYYTHALLNEYPDPADVAEGVVYGPGGSLIGTNAGTSSEHAWDSTFVHEQLFPPKQKRKRRPAAIRWQ